MGRVAGRGAVGRVAGRGSTECDSLTRGTGGEAARRAGGGKVARGAAGRVAGRGSTECDSLTRGTGGEAARRAGGGKVARGAVGRGSVEYNSFVRRVGGGGIRGVVVRVAGRGSTE